MQIPVSLNELLDMDFYVKQCRQRCSTRAVGMLERLKGDLASLDSGIEHMTIFGLFLCIPAEDFADATSEVLLDAEMAWEAGKPFDLLGRISGALRERFECCLERGDDDEEDENVD